MKKLIYSTISVLFLAVLSMTNSVKAQQYFPVVAKFTQLPPYPVYLADFSNPNQKNLSIQIQLKDKEIASKPIRLKLYIEGQGVKTESTELVQGVPSITLALNQIYNIPNSELANYFKQYNLKVSPDQYKRPFQAGLFKFGVQIIDFATNRELSGIQYSTPVFITVNEPPVWVLPANNNNQKQQQPQNINFQWAARHKNVNDVEYEFSITEILSPLGFRGNYQNLFLSQPTYNNVRTKVTTLNYDATFRALLPGRTYAYRVQAIAKRGSEEVGVFNNNGFSEVQYFQYGEKLKPPTNLKLAWNEDAKSLTFNWKGEPEHKTFQIEHRELNKTGPWTKINVTPKNGLLNTEKVEGLEAYKNYDFKLSGTDATNQVASAAPITIGGIPKDVYLKKVQFDTKIEGIVDWAYYASEENVITDKTTIVAPTQDSSTVSRRESTKEALDKARVGTTKFKLPEAIVSLYLGKSGDLVDFKQSEKQLKLIKNVSTDADGKYVFNSKSTVSLSSYRNLNLYLYVKYKDNAFTPSFTKVVIDANATTSQTLAPVTLLANTIRYSPVLITEKRKGQYYDKKPVKRYNMWTGSFETFYDWVEVDGLVENERYMLDQYNLEEVGLYRLKKVVDQHKYLSNEGNASNKRLTLRYNNDDYVLVSDFGGTATSSQIFYNKFYNDKFVVRVKQKGRDAVMFPVNSIEDLEEGKLQNVKDFFLYKVPPAKIYGYVGYKDISNPLAKVRVDAGSSLGSTETDEKGYYEIVIPKYFDVNAYDNMPFAGTGRRRLEDYNFSIQAKSPLNTDVKKIKLAEYRQGQSIRQDLFFKGEAINIWGALVEGEGKPVQGATVIYKGKVSKSNEEGVFSIFAEGKTINDSITIVSEGLEKKVLSLEDFTKISIVDTIKFDANKKEWLELTKTKSLFREKGSYTKTDFDALYQKEFRETRMIAVGIFENSAIVMGNPFKKVKIITYLPPADTTKKVPIRPTFCNVLLNDKPGSINKDTTFITSLKELNVKIANLKDAEELYLEDEFTFKLPEVSGKKDSVYVFKIMLKPADYFYGRVMDSTVFIDGVDESTSTRVRRGEKLNPVKTKAKITFEGGGEAIADSVTGEFKILVKKGQEIPFEITSPKYQKITKSVSKDDIENYQSAKSRKDFYMFETDKDVPEFKKLLGFDIEVESISKYSKTKNTKSFNKSRETNSETYIISGKLSLIKGKAADSTVNRLYKVNKGKDDVKELNFKDIVVEADKAKTNAIPILSQIDFVESEIELKLFGYAPVVAEGNPLGDQFIKMRKLLGVDKIGEGIIGASTIRFAQTKILRTNFGEMELDNIDPEKAKSMKFNDKVSEEKKTELKKDIKAVKAQDEKKEEEAVAEARAQRDKVKETRKALEDAKKADKEAQKSGDAQKKLETKKAVALADSSKKVAKREVNGLKEIPDLEPMYATFATSYIEELNENKEYQIVFKKEGNKQVKGTDQDTRDDAIKAATDKNDKAALKKANNDNNNVLNDENYVQFPIGVAGLLKSGTMSLAGSALMMNVEKESAVLKKSGITMKGIISIPEIKGFRFEKPIIVDKLEVDKKFELKQVTFGLNRGYILQQTIKGSWMVQWTSFQIFNNFKGYGIGGKIFSDKENFVHLKSFAFSVVNGKTYPNIEIDLPKDGIRVKNLRFKTLGKKGISFKGNPEKDTYEFDGSLQISKDNSERDAMDSDSTDKFGNALDSTATKAKIAKRVAAEAEVQKLEDAKTQEQKDKEKAEATAKAEELEKTTKAKASADSSSTTRGSELFPIEVHRFVASTDGKFILSIKLGKLMVKGVGLNVRRLVFAKGKDLKKSEIDELMLLTEDEIAKLSSTTKYNDGKTTYKTDTTGKVSRDGYFEDSTAKVRESVGSANLTIKAVEDKLAKDDPKLQGWAFGFAGGLVIDRLKGLSFESDISLVVGTYGADKEATYQFGEIMLKLDMTATKGMGKIKIATSGKKVGFEGAFDVEIAKVKAAGMLKYYRYPATGEVEFGVGFEMSTRVPFGSVTWTSLGAAVEYESLPQKYKVTFKGSAIITGTSSKVTELKNVFVSIEFNGDKCGAAPVIKGGADLYAKEELFCNVNVELDFCELRVIAKATCYKEIIEGSSAEIKALVFLSSDGFFVGAMVRTVIMSLNVNGLFVLGIECNSASKKVPVEMAEYLRKDRFPRYLFKDDNVTISAIYIGFDGGFEFQSGGTVSVFKVPIVQYNIKAEFRAKGYAGVNFVNGNFMIGFDSKLAVEAYINVLSFELDGKLTLGLIIEGGKTNEMGWNYKAVVQAELEVRYGGKNADNQDCNDFCIASCWYDDTQYVKVCLGGRLGLQYRQKGDEEGFKFVKE